MSDVTNRVFLAYLTRPQLVALAVQRLGLKLSELSELDTGTIRSGLECAKVQEEVRG